MTSNLTHSNPISVVLNGNNYIIWNHHMTILLKSHGLYSYVTGTTAAPTRTANEVAADYAKRVNEWDINNAKILGFINASTTAEINQQFLGYTTAKSLWDFLTKRYSATGLAHQYQLWVTFQTKRQLPDQPVSSYISEMQAIRDHLNMGAPQVHDNTATLYQAYFNQLHLITILMGLQDKFENKHVFNSELPPRWLLSEMGAPQLSPTPPWCDNNSAIQIAHNDVFHERTKHIEIDCHFTRQHVVRNTIQLHPISTLDQPADIFTKAHLPGRFRELVNKLNLSRSSPD
ncbi:hypothetical protein OSB04_010383 [Centaurea solstitialis]|uniref:Retrotransposon Copia-like N-terminal domain-containing protein n=1 Tax=Centaurea solstitialis TaxID=347529 RepID=A0AA38WN29_9ASTR|nr:hypothetical protein OSB04_010383 [Centaurea solstitialis]